MRVWAFLFLFVPSAKASADWVYSGVRVQCDQLLGEVQVYYEGSYEGIAGLDPSTLVERRDEKGQALEIREDVTECPLEAGTYQVVIQPARPGGTNGPCGAFASATVEVRLGSRRFGLVHLDHCSDKEVVASVRLKSGASAYIVERKSSREWLGE